MVSVPASAWTRRTAWPFATSTAGSNMNVTAGSLPARRTPFRPLTAHGPAARVPGVEIDGRGPWWRARRVCWAGAGRRAAARGGAGGRASRAERMADDPQAFHSTPSTSTGAPPSSTRRPTHWAAWISWSSCSAWPPSGPRSTRMTRGRGAADRQHDGAMARSAPPCGGWSGAVRCLGDPGRSAAWRPTPRPRRCTALRLEQRNGRTVFDVRPPHIETGGRTAPPMKAGRASIGRRRLDRAPRCATTCTPSSPAAVRVRSA